MAFNGIVTPYDDLNHPADASHAVPLTFAGGVIKAATGRLLKVVVTTAFAGALGTLVFYDSATAVASSTPLLTIPVAGGVVGAVFSVDLPASAGIAAVNTGGTLTAGNVTVGYS
jgi:hypothetical protein